MLPLDEHMAKIAMDMHKDRVRLQMGDPVPTRWRSSPTLAARSRDLFAAIGCRLATFGRWLQQRERPAGAGRRTARLGAWLSGRLQPQSECR